MTAISPIIGKEKESIIPILNTFLNNANNLEESDAKKELVKLTQDVKDTLNRKIDSVPTELKINSEYLPYYYSMIEHFFTLLAKESYLLISNKWNNKSNNIGAIVNKIVKYYDQIMSFRDSYVLGLRKPSTQDQQNLLAQQTQVAVSDQIQPVQTVSGQLSQTTQPVQQGQPVQPGQSVQQSIEPLQSIQEQINIKDRELLQLKQEVGRLQKINALNSLKKQEGDEMKCQLNLYQKRIAELNNQHEQIEQLTRENRDLLAQKPRRPNPEFNASLIPENTAELESQIKGLKAEICRIKKEKRDLESQNNELKLTNTKFKLREKIKNNILQNQNTSECTLITNKNNELLKEIEELRKQLEERSQQPQEEIKDQSCVDIDGVISNNNTKNGLRNNILESSKTICENLIRLLKPKEGETPSSGSSYLSSMNPDDKKKKIDQITDIKNKIDVLIVKINVLLTPVDLTSNSNPDDCKQLIEGYAKIDKEFEEIQNKDLVDIVNLNEDLSGAVRVYVKVRGGYGNITDPLQKQKLIDNWNENNENQVSDYNDFIAKINNVFKIKNDSKNISITCNQREIIGKNYIIKSKNKDYTIESKKKEYKNFNGVFGMDFDNSEVYTGFKKENSSEKEYFERSVIGGDPLTITFKTEKQNDISKMPPNLFSAFRQVADGYHICLFGYGFSGSGKTFTLLGGENVPGILHYGLANLNYDSIQIHGIYELYMDRNIKPENNTVRGNIIKLKGNVPVLTTTPPTKSVLVDESKDSSLPNLPNFTEKSLFSKDLNSLTTILTKYRKEKGRIKETKNNPESSRSHLFITFKVQLENGNKGYITIVDMAGQEDPTVIYRMFLNEKQITIGPFMKNIVNYVSKSTKSVGNNNNNNNNPWLDNNISDDNKIIAIEIIKEGFYINETLNHLKAYFRSKIYTSNDTAKKIKNINDYNSTQLFVAGNEMNVDGTPNIDPNNNCLMQPILKYLDNLNADPTKPTKFIMICAVRPDKCQDNINALDFADSVKSSGQSQNK